MYCWGLREEDDIIAYWSKQHRIGTDDDWDEISSGLSDRYQGGVSGCGLRSGDSLWCLGAAVDGQLGDNHAPSDEPVRVSIGMTR